MGGPGCGATTRYTEPSYNVKPIALKSLVASNLSSFLVRLHGHYPIPGCACDPLSTVALNYDASSSHSSETFYRYTSCFEKG